MINKRLVVAKYKENIDWVKHFNGDFIVYDKNHNENLLYNEIKLINKNLAYLNLHPFGWEEHTKFLHIIKNYPNFYDWEIFVQGSPFDHCSNILEKINNLENQENFKNGYVELSHREAITCRWNGPVLYGESDQTETNPIEFANGINPCGQSRSMLLKYFRSSLPDTTTMQVYSMYAIKRENLLKFPLATYQRFFEEKFNPESKFADPGIRWFLEYGSHLIWNDKYL